jgi:hypothetical protein
MTGTGGDDDAAIFAERRLAEVRRQQNLNRAADLRCHVSHNGVVMPLR